MKRLVAVLAFGLAAISIYAVTAPASQQGANFHVQLQRRVTSLEKKVSQLQKSVRTLNTFRNCLSKTAAAMASYGSPASGQGYLYVSGQQQALTTALDLVPQGQSPQFYVPAIESSCIGTGRLGHAPRILNR